MASLISGISTRLEMKPGGVVDLDGRLVQLLREREDRVEGGLRGLQAANDLDQLHHRHRIEEVHADHLLGALRPRGDLW